MSRRNSGLFSKVIKKIRRKPGIHSRERRISSCLGQGFVRTKSLAPVRAVWPLLCCYNLVLFTLTSLLALLSFMRILAASALVRAPGIPCFWLRSFFTFLRSPLKTTNLEKLLERHDTTAIPQQIYLPTRESKTYLPKKEKARVTSPYHLKAGRKLLFPAALFTKLETRRAF